MSKLGGLISVPTNIALTPENAWKNQGQVMVIKAYSHLESIAELAGFRDRPGSIARSYIDYGSISVLARTTYETYVLFKFLFLDKNSSLREFRHQVWRLSGLMSRMKLNRPPGLPRERLEQIKREEAEIARLRAVIEENPFFTELDKKVQKSVRQGDGVRLGTALIDLAEQAGLPRKYAADMYAHFCNHSHASAISVYQLSDALSDRTTARLARVTVSFCCLLLTLIILSYTELFPEVDAAVAGDDELCESLALWKGIGESWTHLYDDWTRF